MLLLVGPVMTTSADPAAAKVVATAVPKAAAASTVSRGDGSSTGSRGDRGGTRHGAGRAARGRPAAGVEPGWLAAAAVAIGGAGAPRAAA